MSATHRLLRFGVFELNLDTEELRKLGTVVKLRPQPFRLLAMLASHAGQVVTREEIREQLWGEDAYVDFEHGVNRCIKQIREVLGDDIEKAIYIETLPRQGYRFLVPVTSKNIAGPKPAVVESDSDEHSPTGALNALRSALAVSATPHGSAVPALEVVRPEVETSSAAKHERGEAAAGPHVSRWRSRGIWIVAALVVIAAAGGGLYRRYHRRPTLTEKDTIVLADFDNSTGEAVFNGTLRQGLWADLEQSPFLNMLPDQRITQTLRLMAQPRGAVLTPALAREICIRTGSTATLEGAIARLGQDYVVSLKAVNCQTGEEMAVEQFTVDGREKILSQLGNSAARIRSKLGESLASVEKYNVPLPDLTTPSLEALQAFTLGRTAKNTKGNTAALPYYEQAVLLDPTFAVAYLSQGICQANLNQPARAAENIRKAYELRDKVSLRERYLIEARYYNDVTGELNKAIATLEIWEQTYPHDFVPRANLSQTYLILGKFPEAVVQASEAIKLNPNNLPSYINLGGSYQGLNRLGDAEAVYKQAEEHKLSNELLGAARYQVAFLDEDRRQMVQCVTAAQGKPGAEDVLLAAQANTEAWFGRFAESRKLTQRAMDSATRNDAKEAAALYQATASLWEAAGGYSKFAHTAVQSAVLLAPNRDVRATAALVMAQSGDARAAEKLVNELNTSYPLNMLVQTYWLPTIRAAIELQRKNPDGAIELLQRTNGIELAQPGNSTVALCPVYIRGQAYLMLHDGRRAAAEFDKFIDYRGVVGNFPWGSLARLGLARAYAIQGDTPKARAAYEDFLTLWKDADPDIPIYKQAQAEYEKLASKNR
jgi:DNA-binding winged helix-turn-helix (wHTH) protein/predicted Zn-dependent protease